MPIIAFNSATDGIEPARRNREPLLEPSRKDYREAGLDASELDLLVR